MSGHFVKSLKLTEIQILVVALKRKLFENHRIKGMNSIFCENYLVSVGIGLASPLFALFLKLRTRVS
jgi:hypothetical protein